MEATLTKTTDDSLFARGLFPLGRLVATAEANRTLGLGALILVGRHVTGDWGDLSDGDKSMNDRAVKSGDDRILSAYVLNGERYYVITEWDRSATTVLLASEY